MVKCAKQGKLLKTLDWDVLIILDACRVDSFIKVFPNLLFNNIIQIVDTEVTDTGQWLVKHWSDDFYSDIVYVSGNPFVNSKGVSTETTKNFDGRKHFGKIVDSWDWGFNRLSGRIEPDRVAADFFNYYWQNPGARFIIHFMQPHSPYLFNRIKPEWINIARRFIPKKLFQFMRHHIPRYIRKETHLHVPEYNYKRVYNDDEIRNAYERNLKDVKPYVEEIIKSHPNMNIIVTADHTEYLGENGRYGHGGKSDDMFLRSVPFLRVVGDKKW